jgi:beta-glucosidase
MTMNLYDDVSRSPEERAEDLLSRMSLEEKFGQIQCTMPFPDRGRDIWTRHPHGVGEISGLVFVGKEGPLEVAREIRSLQEQIMALSEHHIPAIFHIETLTGVLMPGATGFASGMARGSTWNPDLEKEKGRVERSQAVAVGARQAFAPVLDVTTDPRFGRHAESYSEDATLVSAMGTAYVQGIQNDGDLAHGMLATSKHFLASNAASAGMHAAPVEISERTLRERYAKPFQAAITEGGLRSLMNSYGPVNREPVVGSKRWLTDLLRGEMGFKGFTVSDYGAISDLIKRQKVSASPAEAGRRALEAGMDVECPAADCYGDELRSRIADGTVEVRHLDRAVKGILTAKFELGLFENPFPLGDDEIGRAFADESARETSRRIAAESLILLKNDGLLPLVPRGKRIVVVGCHADSTRSLFGGYTFVNMADTFPDARSSMAGVSHSGASPADVRGLYPGTSLIREHLETEAISRRVSPYATTLLSELRAACPDSSVTYVYGYDHAGTDESHIAEALEACRDADVVLATVGGRYGWSSACTTGEGIDTHDIGLPPAQERFLERLGELGRPCIAIHFDGRPISSDAADRVCGAILEAWNPAEYGAAEIVLVLVGTRNPGGKLPVTVARNAGQIPIRYDHDHGESSDVGTGNPLNGYIALPWTPRYVFGHGLSFTTFDYSDLSLDRTEMPGDGTIEIAFRVANTGLVPGDEVVQLYFEDRFASIVRPVRQLVGFRRVPLEPGESKTVSFSFPLSQLAFLDSEMRWKVEAGDMDIQVGASSSDIRLTGTFHIQSDAWVEGSTRGFCAASRIA